MQLLTRVVSRRPAVLGLRLGPRRSRNGDARANKVLQCLPARGAARAGLFMVGPWSLPRPGDRDTPTKTVQKPETVPMSPRRGVSSDDAVRQRRLDEAVMLSFQSILHQGGECQVWAYPRFLGLQGVLVCATLGITMPATGMCRLGRVLSRTGPRQRYRDSGDDGRTARLLPWDLGPSFVRMELSRARLKMILSLGSFGWRDGSREADQ